MITILCSGSRGDIQPYLALAQELKQLGNEVQIAAGISFQDFVESYDIAFYPLAADLQTVNVDPKLLEAAGNSTSPLKMLLTFNKMKKYARFMVDDMYNACQGSELIIYHPGCTIGYFAAEKLGIPSVLASPFPMLHTKEVASVIAYGKSRMSPKQSYVMIQSMLWMASKNGVASFWKERFGKLPEKFGCPFERVDNMHPSIVSCSNYVFQKPHDWNENVHQYGYWFLKENETYVPSKKLHDFLEQGEKPIYFGFGSMFNAKEKDNFVKIVCEALKQTGKRGIICGMGKIPDLPSNIIALDALPHTWLFSKCAAVCHHGGAGTSAAGFAAGVPSIIVPFSNDQFAWAHRSYDLGVGSYPIYKKQLSADKLTDAISYALSETVLENSTKLGNSISGEDGAKRCAEILTELLRR
jgi:sterol 3beta-glucosyltransferase